MSRVYTICPTCGVEVSYISLSFGGDVLCSNGHYVTTRKTIPAMGEVDRGDQTFEDVPEERYLLPTTDQFRVLLPFRDAPMMPFVGVIKVSRFNAAMFVTPSDPPLPEEEV